MSQGTPKLYNIMAFNDSEVYFTGKVYADSMIELLCELKKCESKILEKEHNKDPFCEDIKTPIRLHIYCTGGLTLEAFFAVDKIRMLKVPLHTIVSGLTASAGTILSCIGTRRYITRNAHMLIHGVRSLDGKGNVTELRHNTVDDYGVNWTAMVIRHYVRYTKMTREMIEEIFSERDRYMSPEECLEKGLVDEIID